MRRLLHLFCVTSLRRLTLWGIVLFVVSSCVSWGGVLMGELVEVSTVPPLDQIATDSEVEEISGLACREDVWLCPVGGPVSLCSSVGSSCAFPVVVLGVAFGDSLCIFYSGVSGVSPVDLPCGFSGVVSSSTSVVSDIGCFGVAVPATPTCNSGSLVASCVSGLSGVGTSVSLYPLGRGADSVSSGVARLSAVFGDVLQSGSSPTSISICGVYGLSREVGVWGSLVSGGGLGSNSGTSAPLSSVSYVLGRSVAVGAASLSSSFRGGDIARALTPSAPVKDFEYWGEFGYIFPDSLLGKLKGRVVLLRNLGDPSVVDAEIAFWEEYQKVVSRRESLKVRQRRR